VVRATNRSISESTWSGGANLNSAPARVRAWFGSSFQLPCLSCLVTGRLNWSTVSYVSCVRQIAEWSSLMKWAVSSRPSPAASAKKVRASNCARIVSSAPSSTPPSRSATFGTQPLRDKGFRDAPADVVEPFDDSGLDGVPA
jgi:hypothetical protein